jgi:multidrug efflux pump subunit AcrB
MSTIIRFLVERGLIVNLISVFIIAIGLATSIFFTQIEAFPNINLDKIYISIVYPGASPQEVEQLVVIPIEQELRALNGVNKIISMSFPGSGRIVLEVDPNANNRTRLSSEVSLAVDRAQLPGDLPADPVVLEVDGAVFPIMRVSISAPLNEVELKRLGDVLIDDLLTLPGVARVNSLGDRKVELRVLVNPQQMKVHRVSVKDIANTLVGWNLNTPGGNIDSDDGQKSVRVVGELQDAQDIEDLVISANAQGHTLRLGDVSSVTEALKKPLTLYDMAGKPALSFLILKKSSADIIKTVDAVNAYLDTVPSRYGVHIKINVFQDFSHFARLRLQVLTTNGMVGLFLVFATLLLFLRPSVALTTAWGLPIIFMAGIYALYLSGMTLNLISMMGFIMVLGMLVDDAIIIGENITWHMEQGLSPVESAVKGAVELLGPVTTTIMTTIVAFLPMMFMSGIIGKFIIAIPIVVISLLIFSWLESFLILPSHVASVTNADRHPPERQWLLKLESVYGKALEKTMHYRWLMVIFSFAVLIFAIVLAKSMLFQLFPTVAVNEYIVRVVASPGTSLLTMQNNLRRIDHEMRKHLNEDYVEATLAKSGDISLDAGDPLTQRGSRYGQIRTIYIPSVSRPHHSALDDMHRLAEILPKKFPEFDIAVTAIRPGPPVGRALEAEISSSDDRHAAVAAHRLIQYLQSIQGVLAVDSGLKQGDDELHVVLNRELATYAGVNITIAAQQIRAAVGGLVVSSIRRGKEEIDVTIRFPENNELADINLSEVQQLKQLLIPNNRGGLVPLKKIATFKERKGFTTIRHKDGIRIVNVVADINDKVISSNKLNNIIRNAQAEWAGDVSHKIVVNYGGEEEKNQQSFKSLQFAFGFALIAIFFILAIQFNNMVYPLIVMLAIPFGAIGVIFSFYLHDLFWKPMPLSFFSSLGMVALTGVVVNSSLILLVFIQRARQQGMEVHAAIIQAGRRRLRAVLLTAITTIVGLLPTAYGWGGLDHFVSPMALALSWGLVFATFVTLFTIPATLAVGHDVRAGLRMFLGLSR